MEISYEFKEEDALRFAHEVGAKCSRKGDELAFTLCPLCHGGQKRDKNTFSINLRNGKCKCQRASCSYKGNMITLARDFGFQLNEDVSRYYNIGNYNGRFKKFADAHRPIESKDEAIEYLAKRGISENVVKRYEITIKNEQKNILVFPFKNEDGELKFIKYRNITFVKGQTEGSKEWCESNCMPILFGMAQCNLNNKRLIITEGQIDSLSVTEAGFENAVSVPTGMNGFTWIPHCWSWITEHFEEIVVFGDKEKDGTITLLDEISRKFKIKVLSVQAKDYLDCKDANEILMRYGQEQIKVCIANAKAVPLKQIIDLSTVKSKNIYEIEKLKTGITALDKLLKGGLPFGGITLLTGKAGEGKSTLGSQLLLQAIEQGYKCFAYSGELPNYIFKEWMDFQCAGSSQVRTYKNDSTDIDRYVVPEEVVENINDWYRGKCFLYDNEIANEDDETETLTKLIEEAVLHYDVKVVLIDNLMTALDLEPTAGSDKYEKQSEFMKKLTRLALKYELCVILVAHKRKNGAGTNENDEIAGASEIGNLGMVTLTYQRGGKECNDDQRLLKISKNRLFGAINNKGWVMNYEPSTKRVVQANDSFDFSFSFNKIKNIDFAPVDDSLIPF